MTTPAAEDPPDDLIATITDYKGRTVWLTQERMDHIQVGHPEVRAEHVKRALETADRRSKGNRPTTEKLWARNIPPAKWFTVVVAYEGRLGRVKTAIPSSDDPKTGELI